jgi:hypothetical protein
MWKDVGTYEEAKEDPLASIQQKINNRSIVIE